MSDAKKRKQYYSSKYTKKAKTGVDVGLKGFLCSCNGHEKECVRESYNLLNKYADILYPSKEGDAAQEKRSDEDELSAEIQSLKSHAYRFKQMESGAKNLLFINTTLENPLEIASAIVKDIESTQNPQTRHLIRLVPIQQTCKAFLEDVQDCAKLVLSDVIKENQSFSIVFNHRNNNSLQRDEVIKAVAEIASNLERSNKVDLKNPDVSIIIEVVKNIVYFAAIPDYVKYRKFNLLITTQALPEKESKVEDVEEKVTNDEVKRDN